MRQILRINKMIFYIPIGIIIIIFRQNLINYLSLIVGIPLLIISLEGLIYEIASKNFKNEHNRLGEEIVKFILSCVIIFVFNNDVEMISVIWGIIAILQALKELSKAIYEINTNKNKLYIFLLIQTTTQIVLAILLIIEPKEHVDLHLILLGVEFLLESLRILLTFVNNKKKKIENYDSNMIQ